VTEQEWLDGDCPRQAYLLVRGRATDRQARLLMAACCRLLSEAFFDPRIERALAAVERCADDPEAEAAANAVWFDLVTAQVGPPSPGASADVAAAILDVWQLLDEQWLGVEYQNLRHALSHAAYLSLREKPRVVFTGGEGDAVEICVEAVLAADEWRRREGGASGDEGVGRQMVGLLHDLFGSPSRPAAFDASWRTTAVMALARCAYEERSFDLLPVLADALQDAGCPEGAITSHLREPGPHVRGCWAVDLALGLR
jgi:hypothetical protein